MNGQILDLDLWQFPLKASQSVGTSFGSFNRLCFRRFFLWACAHVGVCLETPPCGTRKSSSGLRIGRQDIWRLNSGLVIIHLLASPWSQNTLAWLLTSGRRLLITLSMQ